MAAKTTDVPETDEVLVQENEAADIEEETTEKEELTEEDFVKEEKPVVPSNLSEEDADEFQKEATIIDAFLRRSITIPGRKKRREAFREEEAIIGDEAGEIATFASKKKREYEILSDSAKSEKPKVLYGRVDGVEEIVIGNLKSAMVVCHLVADNRADINTDREIDSAIYKIKIPAPMFFVYNREEMATQEGYPMLKKNLDMRVGAIVEFVVYDINMAEEDVLASRIRAMQILSYDYYLSSRAQIKPGVLAKGYVQYVNSKGVVVDVLGSDCFIPNDELAWKFIGNALEERKDFAVGKAVPVRIKSVEKASAEIYGRNYPYIRTTGSIKDAKPNPNKQFFEKFELGQKYIGEIAYRLATGEYIVNLGATPGNSGDRATCICKAPAIELGGTPYPGQQCSVAITSKNNENYRFSGTITYLEPTRN